MADPTSANGHPGAVEEIERQVERASLFTHASLRGISERVDEVHAVLGQLIEILREQGTLAPSDDEESTPDGPVEGNEDDGERDLLPGAMKLEWPGIAVRVDGEEARKPAAEVNCAERMHVCKAVCCKLHFALSPQEVESSAIKWDLGQPYVIRHDADGYCAHNEHATGGCSIYSDRPTPCRAYSCVNDPRIWKDFDNMVLNEEWIEEHLSVRQPARIVFVGLPKMEAPAENSIG